MPQLDISAWPSQLFWLALTFGALYWLMATYFLPRLGATLEERRDRIAAAVGGRPLLVVHPAFLINSRNRSTNQ